MGLSLDGSALTQPTPPTASRRYRGLIWPSLPAALAALTVLLVCLPSGDRDISAPVHFTPADLGSVALVVAAAAKVLGGERLPRSRLWLAVGAVVVGLGIATVVSIDPVGSTSGLVRYLQLFVIVPLAVVLGLRDRRDLAVLCAAVVVAAVLEGSVGTWQYVTGTGASFGGQSVRAIGTFGALDIIAMATVVGYGIVVALGLAVVLRGRIRVLLLTTATLLVLPLLFSLSRGAAVSTMGAVVVMLIAASPRLALRNVLFGGAGAVLVASAFGAGASGVGERLASIGTSTSTPDSSVQGRYDLWHAAAGIWQDHPFAGVGLKEFAAYRDSYAPVRLSSSSDVADAALGFQREPLLSPHSMYLLVLSEQGLIGFLALAALLIGVAVLTVRRTAQARADGGPPDGRIPDGRLASVVAVGIIARTLIDFVYSDIGGPTTILTSVLLGVAIWWAVQPPPVVDAEDPT